MAQDLLKMSEKQLAELVKKHKADVDVATATKMEVIQALEKVMPVEVVAEEEEIEVPAPKATKAEAPKAPAKVRIIVHNQDGVENTPFVKVCANGNMYALPRETECVVPQIVINVLRDAVVTRDEFVGENVIQRNAPRFPFTILGPAE
jgi:hypothetical protein